MILDNDKTETNVHLRKDGGHEKAESGNGQAGPMERVMLSPKIERNGGQQLRV